MTKQQTSATVLYTVFLSFRMLFWTTGSLCSLVTHDEETQCHPQTNDLFQSHPQKEEHSSTDGHLLTCVSTERDLTQRFTWVSSVETTVKYMKNNEWGTQNAKIIHFDRSHSWVHLWFGDILWRKSIIFHRPYPCIMTNQHLSISTGSFLFKLPCAVNLTP